MARYNDRGGVTSIHPFRIQKAGGISSALLYDANITTYFYELYF